MQVQGTALVTVVSPSTATTNGIPLPVASPWHEVGQDRADPWLIGTPNTPSPCRHKQTRYWWWPSLHGHTSIPSAAVPSWPWKASQGLLGEQIRGFLNVISPGHHVPKIYTWGNRSAGTRVNPVLLQRDTSSCSLERSLIIAGIGCAEPARVPGEPKWGSEPGHLSGIPGEATPDVVPWPVRLWGQDTVPSTLPVSCL